MKKIIKISYWASIVLTLGVVIGCSESSTGPGGDPTKSASFSSTEVVWNTTRDVIWIESDLTITGYSDREQLTVGGYWYKRNSNGDYYYVKAGCTTNVPKNYIGRQFLMPVTDDNVFINSQKFGVSDFSCFDDKSSTCYGKIKLYNSKSIGIDPNTKSIARSSWVSFSWSSNVSGSVPDTLIPIITVLSAEESQLIDLDIEEIEESEYITIDERY